MGKTRLPEGAYDQFGNPIKANPSGSVSYVTNPDAGLTEKELKEKYAYKPEPGSSTDRIQKYLKELTKQRKKADRKARQNREPIDKTVGVGLLREAGAGGAGVEGPLTEQDLEDREYYAAQSVSSTDGLFVLNIRAIKKVILLDEATQTELDINWLDTYEPPP